MAHFFLGEFTAPVAAGSRAAIEGPEARHAVTVSRIGVGERVTLGNGAGLVLGGTVVTAEHERLEIDVESAIEVPQPRPAIFLAQALAKADRDELAVQVATELGVDGVIPWTAGRSISRWEGAKVAKGDARWRAVVREATKQSMRAWIPDVLPLVSARQLSKLGEGARLIVLDPAAGLAITDLHLDDSDLIVVVGPEGGISESEFDLFASAGGTRVRLGANVLRTSTAGPAAIAVLSAKLHRW
jgi:16S rRNA (uracil1498-N3)-methyltransferase